MVGEKPAEECTNSPAASTNANSAFDSIFPALIRRWSEASHHSSHSSARMSTAVPASMFETVCTSPTALEIDPGEIV